MGLKIKTLKFLAGRPVCILHEKTAKKLNLHISDRIIITKKRKRIISVIDIAVGIVKPNEIAVSDEIINHLNLQKNSKVEVKLAPKPLSNELIKKKLDGKKLNKKEINEIIKDIANNSLTGIEIAFFVSAIYSKGFDLKETKYLIDAMLKRSNKLKINGKVGDKHSIGGGGNRTSPIIVSICSSAGLIMPKTSSRAITSAAGTADVIETLAQIDFSTKDLKKIINKTKACFVWGGGLGLVPVDSRIIEIEKQLNIDSSSQLLASILSKKMAVDSNYIVIDIPYGPFAKVDLKKAKELKLKFSKLAKKFNLKIKVYLTKGDEPIGNGIGPVLEMIDVLKVLKRDNPSKDLENKSLMLSASLLELSGKSKKGKGMELAKEILYSGKAFEKFKEIIKAQKGKIKPLKLGKYKHTIYSDKTIKIKSLNNRLLNQLARFAGCPENKSAGIYLYKKKNQRVKKGEKILTIYSESKIKLKNAEKFLLKNKKNIILI